MNTGEKILAALQPHKMKKTGQNQYRCNSPLRAGSDSHSFVVVIHEDGEHGAYEDKVSGDSGSLYTLAEKLNIEVPRAQATETKRAYRDLADYAQAHGLDAAPYLAAGWKECVHDERPALSFPTANGLRYRFLDGQTPAYKSPQGYKNCWYGLKRAIDLATEKDLPLVLCNGAPSVVVAQHYGIPAAALAGGGQRIPADLLEQFKAAWQGDVILAMDCDSEGQAAARNYHEQLPASSIIDLGMTNKGDLADFCQLYTDKAADEIQRRVVKFEAYQEAQTASDLQAALRDLTAAVKRGERNTPELGDLLDKTQATVDSLRQKAAPALVRPFSELTSANMARLQERRRNPDPVQGLRSGLSTLDRLVGGFSGGRVYMIYGDTNMGKSTLAVSIAAAFIRQGRGLILSTESRPEDWLDKLAACLCRLPFDCIETGQVSDDQYNDLIGAYARLDDSGCSILDAGSPTPQILGAALRSGQYAWVVIDSISKMKMPGTDGGIYETTRLVADGVQDLCREANIPFLVTCQIGRNLKDRAVKIPQVNDALGAGTIEQNADVVMTLYNHSHYVKAGLAEPDPNFPDDMALLKIAKHRWRPGLNKSVWLSFVGGSRFYETEVKRVDVNGHVEKVQ